MKNYQHIVVGIDFSAACLAALKTAVRYASQLSIKVTACHVMEDFLAAEIKRAYQFDEEQLRLQMMERLQGFLAESDLGTCQVGLEISIGSPFLILSELSKRNQETLLILGTQGTHHSPNQVGPVAAKCIRYAPCDVLLVREDAGRPFQKVTVGVDFSGASAKAVKAAASLATLDQASLECLHVYLSPMAMTMAYAGFLPSIPVTDDLIASNSESQLKEFVGKLLADQPLQYRCEVLEGMNIRQTIIDRVSHTHADLIVLGTHGHSEMRHFFLGSTAESLVKHAPCSILAVKPQVVNGTEENLPGE